MIIDNMPGNIYYFTKRAEFKELLKNEQINYR